MQAVELRKYNSYFVKDPHPQLSKGNKGALGTGFGVSHPAACYWAVEKQA